MRVGLFVTCLVDLMRPRIGFAALKLIEATDADVVVPRSQTCCGQPAYNSGDRRTALTLARKTARDFAGCDAVVVPSGSCAGMVRVHYPRLADEDPEPARAAALRALAARTYELSDFLTRIAPIERLPGCYDGTLTYHDACSGLRELEIKQGPRALLARVPGARLVEMREAETCCGFGGTFAVKFGEVSSAMADKKCRHILETGATAVVAGDLGCLLNIEGRLRRCGERSVKALHFAEVLAGEVD
jgi:L-lactate dehydrogenase complex protein LldE